MARSKSSSNSPKAQSKSSASNANSFMVAEAVALHSYQRQEQCFGATMILGATQCRLGPPAPRCGQRERLVRWQFRKTLPFRGGHELETDTKASDHGGRRPK